MNKVYGYARVSTKQQSITRQIKNIKQEAEARGYVLEKIYEEQFSGKTLDRTGWQKLYKRVKPGDTIIFDEVSRLSRNAQEGFEVYQELYSKGVNLIFIKEHHIDTSTYRESLAQKQELTGIEEADIYIEATNKLFMVLARKQIEIAFNQAENEREFLRQRVREGLSKAKKKGKPGGLTRAKWYEERKDGEYKIKKEAECKPKIIEHSIDFNGKLSDKELMDLLHISRNTFYKYKRELKAEQN